MYDGYMTGDELESSMQEFKHEEIKNLKSMIHEYNVSLIDKDEIHV